MADIHASFKRSQHPTRDFRIGRVFRALYAEAAAESSHSSNGVIRGNYQQYVYHGTKIFLVILQKPNYCICWMISSHGQRGVDGPGPIKSEHLIVHDKHEAPEPLPGETSRNGKPGLSERTIRLSMRDGKRLSDFSRLNFGKFYTFEYNRRIEPYAQVHEESLPVFHNLIEEWFCPAGQSRASGLKPEPPTAGPSHLSTRANSDDLVSKPFPESQIYKIISGTGKAAEEFDRGYKPRSIEFFTVGKVFTVLTYRMSDPSGADDYSVVTDRLAGYTANGEVILETLLWFVVVKTEVSGPLCLRILSYQGQGVPEGFVKNNHSIIHSTKEAPEPATWERACRWDLTSMRPPVFIRRRNRGLELDAKHRVRWNAIYRVMPDILACEFGDVHRRYIWRLKQHIDELSMPLHTDFSHDQETANGRVQSESPHTTQQRAGQRQHSSRDKGNDHRDEQEVWDREGI